MSTYYYFHCTKHQESGGCWTRQAWGYGNADLIEAFKFVMYHVRECGEQNIGMHSEHDDDGYTSTCIDDDARAAFLENTRDIFPHSDDRAFMVDHRGNEKVAWVDVQKKLLADGG